MCTYAGRPPITYSAHPPSPEPCADEDPGHGVHLVGDLDLGPHDVGAVADVDRHHLGDGGGARVIDVARPRRHGRRAVEDERRERPVVEGEDLVALGLLPPPGDHVLEDVGVLGGQVVAFRGVPGHVVELRRHRRRSPGRVPWIGWYVTAFQPSW